MYILGISDSLHDQSVCLHKGTNPICMIELERLIRLKHNLDMKDRIINIGTEESLDYFATLNLEHMPVLENEEILNKGIDYCLSAAKIKKEDIDLWIGSSLHFHKPFAEKMHWINHYNAHAASVFFSSPYPKAAILIIDGYGESYADKIYEVLYTGLGNGNQIRQLQRHYGKQNYYYDMNNSLGVFYRNASILCGFDIFSQGKIMGLASYGKPLFHKKIWQHINLSEKGHFFIDNKAIFQEIMKLLPKKHQTISFDLKANIAATMQDVFEKIIFHILRNLYAISKTKNLCFAGGVAFNSVLNGKILEHTDFKSLYIYPAAGDSGISQGACLWGAYHLRNMKRNHNSHTLFKTAFLGKRYNHNEIIEALNHFQNNDTEKKIKWKRLHDNSKYQKAAQNLSLGKIIGWFQGGSEIGPRALGHRSILADPRKKEMRDYVNKMVKYREMFRPFAPSVLIEHARKYFNIKTELPFMLQVVKATSQAREKTPAIVHIDGTARVQTVDKKYNNDFYNLIKHFYKITRIPLLLNTSFNVKDEPIVESPLDALKCFVMTNIDIMYIENFEIEKI